MLTTTSDLSQPIFLLVRVHLSSKVYGLMVEPPQLNTTLFTIYVGILRNIYIIVSKYQVGILEVNLPIVSTNCALVFIMEQSQSTQI